MRAVPSADKNIDTIFDEIYSFTKFLLSNEIEETASNAFLENYRMFLTRISFDYPAWRKRFNMLFSRYRNTTEMSYTKNIGVE